MKRVSIFLLSFVMALALARPAFALVDGADLDFNAYNKKVNAGPGALYPLIKNTFYDGSGNLRQTYGGDYSGDDVSEELPGKTPVEFISAYDMETTGNFWAIAIVKTAANTTTFTPVSAARLSAFCITSTPIT